MKSLARTHAARRVSQTTVVHVVGTLRDGGAEALVRSLLPRLAQEPDLDVHVISVYEPRLDAAECAALGVPVHRIGRRGRTDLGFAPRLYSTLRRLRPDIVHGHIHTGKYAGRIAAIAAGVPKIVFTEHGDEAGGALRWAVKRVLNARTDRFIVFTENDRQAYARAEAFPATRIVVIPNGIPLPAQIDRAATRAELGLEPDDIAIITAARLVHQKNQELVIRAIARLRDRYKIKLFVAGDGPDRPALDALAAATQADAAVTFLGYRTDAQRLTAACEIMALPSRWEKMPLVLGEAMLAGIPVVSTPWTGVDAFIDDGATGYLAAGWGVDDYCAALTRALDDAAGRRRIAAAAAQSARERFDLTRTAAAHATLYRTLANSAALDQPRH